MVDPIRLVTGERPASGAEPETTGDEARDVERITCKFRLLPGRRETVFSHEMITIQEHRTQPWAVHLVFYLGFPTGNTAGVKQDSTDARELLRNTRYNQWCSPK